MQATEVHGIRVELPHHDKHGAPSTDDATALQSYGIVLGARQS